MLAVPLYESELKKLCATDEYKSRDASARPKIKESLERRVANVATKQATAGGEKATPRDQRLGRRAKQEAENSLFDGVLKVQTKKERKARAPGNQPALLRSVSLAPTRSPAHLTYMET